MNGSVQCVGLLLTLAAIASVARCQLTDSQKTQALITINHLRRSVRPIAGNMNCITWDTTLEALAQRASDRCVFEHNYSGDYASLGEVVYRGKSNDPPHIFYFMYLERECYNFNTGACNCAGTKYPFFDTCGHYFQLVTAAVSKMGCGIRWCTDNYIFFCEFNRGVSYPPYETGLPGTKCGIGYAVYHREGLCEYYDPMNTTNPVPLDVDCRLRCLVNGVLMNSYPFCQCTSCYKGYSGVRCEKKFYANAVSPNDCSAAPGWCVNGGNLTLIGDVCKCVCPTGFQGENCESNIDQTANSIFICLGGTPIYQSYCPMPVTVYSDDLRAKIKNALVIEVNNFCRANYAVCCPNSKNTVDPFIASSDCLDLANYPDQQMDGTLCIALFIRLNENLATQCWGNSNSYLPKTILMTAYTAAESSVKTIVTSAGMSVAKTS